MVNRLSTISIKVNIPPVRRIEFNKGAPEMNKVRTGRGFWSWLLGSGWSGAGGNG